MSTEILNWIGNHPWLFFLILIFLAAIIDGTYKFICVLVRGYDPYEEEKDD